MRWMNYGRLVRGWIVENRAPHTDWSKAPAPADPSALPAVSPRAR
jgi:hypothetical protein